MTEKEIIKEFFNKATINVLNLEVKFFDKEDEGKNILVKIKTEDPKVLIGEKGATLAEIQRLLGKILRKKTGESVYLNLDINEYKEKKTESLKGVIKELADEVSFTGKEKTLPPMSSYERRVVHTELSSHPNIETESVGEGLERKVIIKPR